MRAQLVVARVRVVDFMARGEVLHLRVDAHRRGDAVREVVQRGRVVGADVEHLVPCPRLVDRRGHHRRHVVDVAERARLRAVAEDGHRLPLQDLVHEDADDVAVAIADVLARTVDVVRPEDHVVEPEHRSWLAASSLLDGVLRDAVRILGRRRHRLPSSATHRALPYTAIEDVNTKPFTPVLIAALMTFTLPMTLFV